LAIGVVSVSRKTETKTGLIALAAAVVELDQARSFAEKQNQNAGGKRIERAEMADLSKAYEMTHGVHYVVRGLALRFVDDESAIERYWLWLLTQDGLPIWSADFLNC
jgi:hypothetical protein